MASEKKNVTKGFNLLDISANSIVEISGSLSNLELKDSIDISDLLRDHDYTKIINNSDTTSSPPTSSIECFSVPGTEGTDYDIGSNGISPIENNPFKYATSTFKEEQSNITDDNLSPARSFGVGNVDDFSSISSFWDSYDKLDETNTLFNNIEQEEALERKLKPSLQNETFVTKTKPDLSYREKSNSVVDWTSGVSGMRTLILEPSTNTSVDLNQFCPQCKSKYSENRLLRYFQISLDSSILLCSTEGCTYPFDSPNETLNIRDQSFKEVVQSEIDFNLNEISVDTKDIEQQLCKLEQDIVRPFLCSVDSLKFKFGMLESGKLDLGSYLTNEKNETMINFINEVLETAEGNKISATKQENSKVEVLNVEKHDIDSFIEEQNREINHMMFEYFV